MYKSEMNRNHKIGLFGERMIKQDLQKRGLRFIFHRFRLGASGEIDLVFVDDVNSEVILVEVRTINKLVLMDVGLGDIVNGRKIRQLMKLRSLFNMYHVKQMVSRQGLNLNDDFTKTKIIIGIVSIEELPQLTYKISYFDLYGESIHVSRF